MTSPRNPLIIYLVLFVFILFAMPRLNIRLGPVPLYGIDVVAALMLYFTSLAKQTSHRVPVPFSRLVPIVGFLFILSEIAGIAYGGSVMDSIYISMRYFLAFSLAFTVPRLIRTAADIEVVLKGLALGLLVTALLMILSSLPITRWIAILVFSISNLEPSNAAQRLAEYGGADGIRGRTLIGVSILSGAFISIAWPLVAYLRTTRFRLSAFWSLVAFGAVTLSPMAIAMSYSRQAALGAIMVLVAVLVLPFNDLRRRLLQPVLVSVGIVLVIGTGSSLFIFDRYENRIAAMFEDPLSDERESHRLLSYVAPFQHMAEHPQFLLLGAGSNNLRSGSFDIRSFEANHSLIGAGYFAHGMISTLILCYMIVATYYYGNWHRKRSRRLARSAKGWPRSIYLAFLPVFPIAAFSPAFGSNIRAMYLYMLLIGLFTTLRNPALMADLQRDPTQGHETDRKTSQGPRPDRGHVLADATNYGTK